MSERVQLYLDENDFERLEEFAQGRGLKIAEAGRYLIVTSLGQRGEFSE